MALRDFYVSAGEVSELPNRAFFSDVFSSFHILLKISISVDFSTIV